MRGSNTEACGYGSRLKAGTTAELAEPARASSRYRAGAAQFFDRGLVVARLAQDLVRVLADFRRLARLHFFGTVDEDRAVDGQHGVVLEPHQNLVLDHLPVVRDIIEDADHAEHQPV